MKFENYSKHSDSKMCRFQNCSTFEKCSDSKSERNCVYYWASKYDLLSLLTAIALPFWVLCYIELDVWCRGEALRTELHVSDEDAGLGNFVIAKVTNPLATTTESSRPNDFEEIPQALAEKKAKRSGALKGIHISYAPSSPPRDHVSFLDCFFSSVSLGFPFEPSVLIVCVAFHPRDAWCGHPFYRVGGRK
jgi:hypothetical protein